MKFKKALSLVLALIMVAAMLAGCGDKGDKVAADSQASIQNEAAGSTLNQDNALLPCGLTFGMSYSQAQATCENFPSIGDASSNDGYFSDPFEPNYDDYDNMHGIDNDRLYEEMYNGDAVVLSPDYFFSFNEYKQLYEFYVISQIFDGEATAEYLFNTYVDYLTEHLGDAAGMRETSTSLSATFETDSLGASVNMEVDGTTYTVYYVIHNKHFDLND